MVFIRQLNEAVSKSIFRRKAKNKILNRELKQVFFDKKLVLTPYKRKLCGAFGLTTF